MHDYMLKILKGYCSLTDGLFPRIGVNDRPDYTFKISLHPREKKSVLLPCFAFLPSIIKYLITPLYILLLDCPGGIE